MALEGRPYGIINERLRARTGFSYPFLGKYIKEELGIHYSGNRDIYPPGKGTIRTRKGRSPH